MKRLQRRQRRKRGSSIKDSKDSEFEKLKIKDSMLSGIQKNPESHAGAEEEEKITPPLEQV